jgi:hypothetical protein
MVRFSGLIVEGEMLRVDGREFWVELGGRLGGGAWSEALTPIHHQLSLFRSLSLALSLSLSRCISLSLSLSL